MSALAYQEVLGMTEDRADWHLWNWSQWMRRSQETGLGYPSRAGGGICNFTSNWEFDQEYDHVCKQLAAATDAVIDGLPARYRAAIYAQRLSGPWELPERVLGPFYRAAVDMLCRGLDRKGIE